MNPQRPPTDDDLVRAARAAVRALPDAPDAWLQRAFALVPAAPSPLVAAAAAGWRVLQAVLTFDSRAQPAAALGMRSAVETTRHLLYSVDGRDIDLRVSSESAGFAIAGQVLGPDETGTVAVAPGDGGAAREAALDTLGGFRIDGLPGGRYALVLRLSGDEIRLPLLDLGDPSR